MAKIESVKLRTISETIDVGDNESDLTVMVKIHFHELDLKLGMEYSLHLYVYDVHGEMDFPLVIPNWDESRLMPIALDSKDEFMGEKVLTVKAEKEVIEITSEIVVKLGKVNREYNYTHRKLEVFATMAPAIGRCSNWSEQFTSRVVY